MAMKFEIDDMIKNMDHKCLQRIQFWTENKPNLHLHIRVHEEKKNSKRYL
jgi:hypothetical protein